LVLHAPRIVGSGTGVGRGVGNGVGDRVGVGDGVGIGGDVGAGANDVLVVATNDCSAQFGRETKPTLHSPSGLAQ